jgi:hypothetical protein
MEAATAMASAPNMSNRDDVTLWASSVLLNDLLSRAATWDERPEAEQLDFFLEWEEMMDRLVGVAEDEANGRLTADQRDQLAQLASRLTAARPVIDRLGLDYPNLGRLSLAS